MFENENQSTRNTILAGMFTLIAACIGIFTISEICVQFEEGRFQVQFGGSGCNEPTNLPNTHTPHPTYTSQPTYTIVVPSSSPYPTHTSYPTYTSHPVHNTSAPNATSVPELFSQEDQLKLTLDTLLGPNNWFCLPDREDGIGIKSLPANFVVQEPLSKIYSAAGNFEIGQTAPVICATADLQQNLPRSKCPETQQQALFEWTSDKQKDDKVFDRKRFNTMFGEANWWCQSVSYAVYARLSNPLYVQYPITFVNHQSDIYGVGEIVPGTGTATVWFAGTISSSECP